MASNIQYRARDQRCRHNVHIVVDNSNLFIGAKQGQGLNGQQDFSIRINVGNLVQILEENINTTNIKTRIVGGSQPPRTSRVWTEWRRHNYECHLGNRDPNNREVFLDDMLHAQIQRLILRSSPVANNVQQTLILVTGDGNANSGRVSFPEVVTVALRNRWNVQLWSWKAVLSNKFSVIRRVHPQTMRIKFLDDYRARITFRETRNPQPIPELQNNMRYVLPIVFAISFLIIKFYFY